MIYPLSSWLFEWNGTWGFSWGLTPADGYPMRFSWTAFGGSHALSADGVNMSAAFGEQQYLDYSAPGADWSQHIVFAEFRFRVNSCLPTGMDCGPRFIVANGERAARIGLVYLPSDALGDRYNYGIGVWDSGTGASASDWTKVATFFWPNAWVNLQIVLDPNKGLEVYASVVDEVNANDLIIELDYDELVSTVDRGISMGKMSTNGGADMDIYQVRWSPVALGRVQPAWVLHDVVDEAFAVETPAHCYIDRHPGWEAAQPLNGLTNVRAFLGARLVAAGWTLQNSFPAGSPDSTAGDLYKLDTADDYWLYMWYFAGVLKVLFYDFDYTDANWAQLDIVGTNTHTELHVSLEVYQQSFMLIDSGKLYWSLYGENPLTEQGALLVLDTSDDLYAAGVTTSPGFIFADNAGTPTGYHRGHSTNWVQVRPNRMLDPGNVGALDTSFDVLRLPHTQPMLQGFLSWAELFRSVVIYNRTKRLGDVVVDQINPYVYRFKHQFYQLPWGSLNSLDPADQEIRFLPANLLSSSNGLVGCICLDEDGRVWIKPGVDLDAAVLSPFAHWMIGPFGTDIDIE